MYHQPTQCSTVDCVLIFFEWLLALHQNFTFWVENNNLIVTNTLDIRLQFKNVILAPSSTRLHCPAKDTRCAAPDGSNVIKTVTTEDDAECGG